MKWTNCRVPAGISCLRSSTLASVTDSTGRLPPGGQEPRCGQHRPALVVVPRPRGGEVLFFTALARKVCKEDSVLLYSHSHHRDHHLALRVPH